MKNVYSTDEFTQNAIVTLPDNYVSDNANTLFSWMGSFWRNLHTGTDFVKGLQNVRAIRLAQFYLDLIESLKLQDRNGAPVFHRELWRPVIIRKSGRNTAQENTLKLGKDGIVAGPQPEGSIYGPGTNLELGKLGAFADYVTYPVSEADGEIKSISSTITDNIINPTVALESGVDFVFRDGTLIFPKANDPFGADTPFDVYDVVSDDAAGETDVETVLWVSDALVDKDYISDHMSYALGADAPSSDIVKRIVNAAWDSLNCGLTPQLLRTLLGAMLNIPVIQEASEIVQSIALTDESRVVKTDFHTYQVSLKAKLRSSVVSGAILERGELLDQSVKIYPFLTDLDVNHLDAITEYAEILKLDVPVIDIPPTLIRTQTTHGLYVNWNQVFVKQDVDDPVDANGNPHLYFDVYGTDADTSAFWEDIWTRAEKANISLEKYLGKVGDPVIPAEFFLKNMVGPNTLIITVDRNQIDDLSMMRNPMFFDMLINAVPSSIRLFFIEHLEIEAEDDTADLGTAMDEAQDYAAVDAEDEVDYARIPGLKGHGPSYDDTVSARFVRRSPRRKYGEED